jgi:hypothetical protein
MEPKEFWEDKDWTMEHYGELQKRYKDKWIAIDGKRVVSYGETRGEVKKHAIEITGKKYAILIYVEGGAAIY